MASDDNVTPESVTPGPETQVDIVALLDDRPKKPNYQDEAHYGRALGLNPGDQYR